MGHFDESSRLLGRLADPEPFLASSPSGPLLRRSEVEVKTLSSERLIKYPERECKIPRLTCRSQLSGQLRLDSSPTNVDSARLFNDSVPLFSPCSQESSQHIGFANRGASVVSQFSALADPRL